MSNHVGKQAHRLVWTAPEFADRVGYHPTTIRRMIKTGEIEATRFGRTWLIPIADVRRLLGSAYQDIA